MKFVISTQELSYLINKCQTIIPQKPTMPILGNFLLEAKNNEIILTATDLTVGIRCFTDAKVLEEGAIAIPAKKFGSLIKELTALNVEISSNESNATEIVADSSRFRLNGMDAADYPQLPDLDQATAIKMTQGQLKDMFFRTAFAVSREDNRYALTGVFLHVANGKATFVGTDGKRLARNQTDVSLDPSFSGNYIVPLKAVDELLKNMGEEGSVTLYLMQDKIAAETDHSLVVTKLLSGDYPDVSRVIPEKSEKVFSLHREELMTLLRQVALFTEEGHHSVKFSFTDGELKLSANTSEVGEGKVSMPVNFHGQQLDIAFNPSYFLDILRHTKGETVTMGLTDPFNPGVITDEESDDQLKSLSSPLFVLMPMRLTE